MYYEDIEDLPSKLKFIQKQFLCCVPIRTFKWLNIFNELNLDKQKDLLTLTINSNLIVRKPVKIGYQKAFLKSIICQLEEEGTEIHDDVYSALGRVVALPESPECFKHYVLENGNIISLQESSNIVSEGTTGLCSWQGAIALSDWCLSHKAIFKNKTVLELGSGIGLTGIVIALHCIPKEIYLTDCHKSVLQTLRTNIKINCETSPEVIPDIDTSTDPPIKIVLSEKFKSSKTIIRVLNLPWEEITENVCDSINPDLLIAADVIYDTTLFSPLINAISCFLTGHHTRELIIACTERNQATLEEFLSLLETHTFNYTVLDLVSQSNFIWSTECPIRIFSVRDTPDTDSS